MPVNFLEPPRYAPNAKATNLGWEDPNTGELLVSIKGLLDKQAALKAEKGMLDDLHDQVKQGQVDDVAIDTARAEVKAAKEAIDDDIIKKVIASAKEETNETETEAVKPIAKPKATTKRKAAPKRKPKAKPVAKEVSDETPAPSQPSTSVHQIEEGSGEE